MCILNDYVLFFGCFCVSVYVCLMLLDYFVCYFMYFLSYICFLCLCRYICIYLYTYIHTRIDVYVCVCVYRIFVSLSYLELNAHVGMRTQSTASRLAPFSISARTDSSSPYWLAYMSIVLVLYPSSCRPAHEKCEHIIRCACVSQYAAPN